MGGWLSTSLSSISVPVYDDEDDFEHWVSLTRSIIHDLARFTVRYLSPSFACFAAICEGEPKQEGAFRELRRYIGNISKVVVACKTVSPRSD